METRTIDLTAIRQTAEHYYSNGDFYCSEAIVKTIRDEFCPGLPDNVIAMASGFPIGIGGAGCTCGAISGGIMAIGMLFGRTEKKDERVNKTMELSRELHDFFEKKTPGALLSRVDTRLGAGFSGANEAVYCLYGRGSRGSGQNNRPGTENSGQRACR